MIKKIKNFFWFLICEADERYPDLTRVGLLLALLSSLCLAFWSVFYLSKDISFVDLCTGLSAILFGGGASVGLRAKLEDGTIFKPKARDEDSPPEVNDENKL